jgi:hypothetical protein
MRLKLGDVVETSVKSPYDVGKGKHKADRLRGVPRTLKATETAQLRSSICRGNFRCITTLRCASLRKVLEFLQGLRVSLRQLSLCNEAMKLQLSGGCGRCDVWEAMSQEG